MGSILCEHINSYSGLFTPRIAEAHWVPSQSKLIFVILKKKLTTYSKLVYKVGASTEEYLGRKACQLSTSHILSRKREQVPHTFGFGVPVVDLFSVRYECPCVCACVRACMRERVSACVRACVRERKSVCMCACVRERKREIEIHWDRNKRLMIEPQERYFLLMTNVFVLLLSVSSRKNRTEGKRLMDKKTSWSKFSHNSRWGSYI